MANFFNSHVIPRGQKQEVEDFRYFISGPGEMSPGERVAYNKELQAIRDYVDSQHRRCVTVAILGDAVLSHRPGALLKWPQEWWPSAICLAGEDIKCETNPRKHPMFLTLNCSFAGNTWENVRQQEVVLRLRAAQVDLIILALGEAETRSVLNDSTPIQAAKLWKTQMKATVASLQTALRSPQQVIMRGIPKFIVLLPKQGQ